MPPKKRQARKISTGGCAAEWFSPNRRGGLSTLNVDKVAAIGARLWRPLENESGRPRGQQNFDWRLYGTNRVRCHPRRPADFITTGNPLNDTVTTEVVPESNEAMLNS